MEKHGDIKITSYDRLLRAWENSMELTRDFEVYSKEVDDDELKEVFKKFAEEEGMHASKFRQLLIKRQNERLN
ncbi:MAG: rubrerythrin [Bacillota bacterium]|nr:rubrerythrin [Bacillota bacterium]NLV61807.1 rubrerythrin [Clostridiaceae bacterium]